MSIYLDATGIDWDEAARFDQWVSDNLDALRKHVFEVRDKYPKAHGVKGSEIITTLYHRNGGAPVA